MERIKVRTLALVALAVMIASVALTSVAPVEAATYTYNRQAAVNYAIANYNKNVPGSWYFKWRGGDCTNFVSWCLYQGGWPMRFGSRASVYSWYYRHIWDRSHSWTVADWFGKFITHSGRGQGFTLVPRPPWNWLRIGDVIQIDYNGDSKMDHTMIITEVRSDDVFVTYHWANSSRVSLTKLILNISSKYPNARFVGYKLYDKFTR